MKQILVICGATATGKSDFAVKCAQTFGGEIISADALAVYQKLNIGTAKPTKEQTNKIKHHLIDVVLPTQNFTVSDYEKLALPIIDNLLSQGKLPIICGGTGFYIKSILFKSQFGNSAANDEVRQRLNLFLAEKGKDELFNKLKEVDKQSADRLHPNDVKRVIRALEIYECSGKKKSDQNDLEQNRYTYAAVFLDRDRKELYERINRRVDEMLANGLLDEVKSLVNCGLSDKNQSMQGIGYKELYSYLKGEIDYGQAVELIKKNTRNYAKRQLTFFKKFNDIRFLPAESCNVESIRELLYDE